MARDEKET
jgi:hypothetical protein